MKTEFDCTRKFEKESCHRRMQVSYAVNVHVESKFFTNARFSVVNLIFYDCFDKQLGNYFSACLSSSKFLINWSMLLRFFTLSLPSIGGNADLTEFCPISDSQIYIFIDLRVDFLDNSCLI